MITVKKIESFKELDKILPLIEEFHRKGYVYYSLSGFLGLITANLLMPYFSIWYAMDDDRIIGYTTAVIEIRFFEKGCTILDAYMIENNEKVSKIFYEEIEDWAINNGCDFLFCFTTREGAIERKYDFEFYNCFLIKKLNKTKQEV